MSRLIGPLSVLLLLLLLGLAKLKIAHDSSQLAAQQQVLPPSPLPMIPAGLDGRTLTTSAQTGPPKPLAPPPVRR